MLDVGTGWGRLGLELAPHGRRVVGIDREPSLLEEARRRASAAGFTNAEFVVADAEAGDYYGFGADMGGAHPCVSDAIAEPARRALASPPAFAFRAVAGGPGRETRR